MLIYLLDILFTIFTFMLIIRVLGSWFPRLAQSKFMHFIGFYTNPYLNLFRRIIPPLGVIDLSPMAAFIALQFIQWILFSFLR